MLRRFLRSTRGRLTLVTGLLFAVAVAVADVGVTVGLTYEQEAEFDAVISKQADTIAHGLKPSPAGFLYKNGELPAEDASGIAIGVAVVAPTGILLESVGQPLLDQRVLELAAPVLRSDRSIWYTFTDIHGVPRRAFGEPVDIAGTPLAVIASRSLAVLHAGVTRLDRVVGGTSLVVLLLGFLVPYFLAARILRPVRQIADVARNLSERDLNRRVEVASEDELGELAATFNGMLSRLEKGVTTLRRFTADASHELRTPLALMRSELDIALHRRQSAENRRLLGLLKGEVENMSALVDQLLLLAQADAATLTARPEPIDVADFLHETAARWGSVARGRQVHLDVVAPDPGSIEADPFLTRRVLDNLLENAIRHSPAGGSVRLEAEPRSGGWAFRVADEGPGIPASDRERIFDRFARVDSARNGDGVHAGLGLALCVAIADVLSGAVQVVDGNDGRGAVFELRLPDRVA